MQGSVMATAMVLQALEGLSDRPASSRLHTDAAWQAAAGLALTEEAFHPTVLVLWRNLLRSRAATDRVFGATRQLLAATGQCRADTGGCCTPGYLMTPWRA